MRDRRQPRIGHDLRRIQPFGQSLHHRADPTGQAVGPLHRGVAASALHGAVLLLIDQVTRRELPKHRDLKALREGRHARLPRPEPRRPKVERAARKLLCKDAPAKAVLRFNQQKITALAGQMVGKRKTRQTTAHNQNIGLHQNASPIGPRSSSWVQVDRG